MPKSSNSKIFKKGGSCRKKQQLVRRKSARHPCPHSSSDESADVNNDLRYKYTMRTGNMGV